MVIFKGQLISKCLFGVFNFFQKTNENKSNKLKKIHKVSLTHKGSYDLKTSRSISELHTRAPVNWNFIHSGSAGRHTLMTPCNFNQSSLKGAQNQWLTHILRDVFVHQCTYLIKGAKYRKLFLISSHFQTNQQYQYKYINFFVYRIQVCKH